MAASPWAGTSDRGTSAPREAWYTFGNHFHWVDMEWLWGHGVLARSLDDMLSFIDRTGAPGNLNFDGIGYEKLAAEEPAALERLREAVADGSIEVVGATYGQPYSQFHHGESAVRQLAYGVRAVQRVVGVRPRAYWEEEFSFFPQLPQLLNDAGFTGASLFFQWTWHTPEIPKESVPAIQWRGIDGSTIPTLPRSELTLHQWPEDIEMLLISGDIDDHAIPVVQQWLELLPSPDWMCRSAIVAPGIQRLLTTPGYTFHTGTLSTVLQEVSEAAPEREYLMDDVFHGMSLGKNGNRLHRLSRELEHTLLAAEACAVRAGQMGRPYAQWGKYPWWELEEAWRELLVFQHHDNDECEGLCGHIGYLGADRGLALARHILDRTIRRLAAQAASPGAKVAVNPLGWERVAVLDGVRQHLPGFGVVTLGDGELTDPVHVMVEADTIILRRGTFSIVVDRNTGLISSVGSVTAASGLGGLRWIRDGQTENFPASGVEVVGETVLVHRRVDGAKVVVQIALSPELDAVDLRFSGDLGEGPDGRAHSALMTLVEPDGDIADVRHDTPYAVSRIEGRSRWQRKYPTGDWMTSPQEFETVVDAFSALQFVDLLQPDGHGLLWIHDGSQGFHRAERGVWNVLSMRDPWDEHAFVSALEAKVRVIPHGPIDDAHRWQVAQEFSRPPLVVEVTPADAERWGPVGPAVTQLLRSSAPSVAVTAVYQDSGFNAAGFDSHVHHRAPHAVLVRLVELNGTESTTDLTFAERPVAAWTCTALGEVKDAVAVHDDPHVTLTLRAHEVATLALQFPPAPGDDRTLDDDRRAWATVHRHDEGESV